MGDDAEAVGGQMERLRLPTVSIERPPVAQNYGPAAAPVLEMDRRSVLGGDRAHFDAPTLATPCAACSMVSATTLACVTKSAWLPGTVVIRAPIRFAMWSSIA